MTAFVGYGYMCTRAVIHGVLRGSGPLHHWKTYKSSRGMSAWHDMHDWLGGLPFEVASVQELFNWGKQKEMSLEFVELAEGGYGCNQMVFVRKT